MAFFCGFCADPPPQPPRPITPDAIPHEDEMIRSRRGGKRGGNTSNRRGSGRPPKRPRMQIPQPEPIPIRQEPPAPPPPPADANYHLKFTYGVNAWRHWVLFKNNQIERNAKPGCGRIKLFKTDIMQCTADELNFSLCLFVKEVRKPNGEEYSPDSIYYLTLGEHGTVLFFTSVDRINPLAFTVAASAQLSSLLSHSLSLSLCLGLPLFLSISLSLSRSPSLSLHLSLFVSVSLSFSPSRSVSLHLALSILLSLSLSLSLEKKRNARWAIEWPWKCNISIMVLQYCGDRVFCVVICNFQ